MADAMSIDIQIEKRETSIVVSPRGDLDMSRSPALRNTLRTAQGDKPKTLIVNLASVEYMDSSGLATLVEAMKNAKNNSTKLVLCAMNQKVKALFEIARLHNYFNIVSSLDDAVGT
ncbi:MAG: STAS domain-containing protein [Phycisphaeraceae bacterium]|nr:STAS domain-containing protein [Phycisphaeraceae bacterium]QYK49583.1 MAG: STAS domain-containing protein [Phycisphaeraceae bacterium]